MMQKLIAGVLLITACSLNLHAGDAIFVGEGSSEPRAPEFFTIKIEVSSLCYAKPLEAQEANDKSAAEIQTLLESYLIKNSNIDKVFTEGGNTERYENILYDGSNHAKTVCRGSFKKVTELTLKTSNIAQISNNFSQIQQAVLLNYTREAESVDSPTTAASIYAPVAGICAETRKIMRDEALAEATFDAKRRFSIAAHKCGVEGSCRIESFSPVANHAYVSRGYDKTKSLEFSSPVVNLNFDSFVETAQIEMKISYPMTIFSLCHNK